MTGARWGQTARQIGAAHAATITVAVDLDRELFVAAATQTSAGNPLRVLATAEASSVSVALSRLAVELG